MTRRQGLDQVSRVAWVCLLLGAGIGACAQVIGADPVSGLLPTSSDGGASSTGVPVTGSGSNHIGAGGLGGASNTGSGANVGGQGGSVSTSASSGGAGPTCSDGIKNGDETDKDCGGSACAPCGSCAVCAASSDCESECCTQNLCIKKVDGCLPSPTCSDGCQNGNETDVDCGGLECHSPCEVGYRCKDGADCLTSTCSPEGLCVAAPPVP